MQEHISKIKIKIQQINKWQVNIIHVHISHGFDGDIKRQGFRVTSGLLCNIFELVFTLCHKCNKYNYYTSEEFFLYKTTVDK